MQGLALLQRIRVDRCANGIGHGQRRCHQEKLVATVCGTVCSQLFYSIGHMN
jgi:hypothetical protein